MENIRLKLSILWVARMLVGLQGDVLRYMEPGMIQEIIDGNLVIPMTNEMLAVMAVMMMIPIFMVFLSIELPYKMNRWLNIIIAIFFIVLDGTGFIIVRPLYENILGIGYVVFCTLIAWYAWKWINDESQFEKH
ncbi:MAG: DUF6326 family protein [Candidatus Thorarchaeota archaeon]